MSSERTSRALPRIAVSALLVVLVLWVAGPARVLGALRGASVPLLLGVVLLHTGDRLLMAYKWWRLLAARGVALSLGDAVRAYYAASFAGIALPMTVGADIVRVAVVRAPSISTGTVVASIAIERTLGAVSQAAWCVLSLLLLAGLGLDGNLSTGNVGLLALATITVLLAAMPLSFVVAGAVARRAEGRGGFVGKLGALADEYQGWRRHRGELAVFLALTFVEGAFPILAYFVAAAALGLDVSLAQIAAVIPIVYLIARLPFSFGGLGGEQVLFVAAAGALGWQLGAMTAVTFLVSPVTLIVALVPGAVAWMAARHRIAAERARAEAPETGSSD